MTDVRARYEFGDFVLDVGQQQLLHRDTGKAIPLMGKAFDTLVYLVEHAGEPLDKDTLLQAIWRGVIVEENSLTQNISTLRHVLGEARDENRYIATLPRKGYRFVAKVARCDEPAMSAPAAEAVAARRWTGWRLAAVAALVIAIALAALSFIPIGSRQPSSAADQKLAILPFKPLLPAERNESLELGMLDGF